MTRVLASSLGYLVFVAACLFLPAETTRWLAAWLLLALQAAVIVVAVFTVDQRLLLERASIERGLRWWDPPLSVLGFVFLIPLGFVLAGFEVKQQHAALPVPAVVQVFGVLLFVAGQLLGVWAMRVNRFFVKFVRIQPEQGHHAITDGPYAYVRHPGYVGGVASQFAAAFMLGSRWALASVAVGGAFFVARTVLEDRMLLAQLPGYRAYAERVRWRWLPGLW